MHTAVKWNGADLYYYVNYEYDERLSLCSVTSKTLMSERFQESSDTT